MRPVLTWYHMVWPREVTPDQVTLVCRLLSAVADVPVFIEVTGRVGRVQHHIGLPPGRAVATTDQLRAALPGLNVKTEARAELTPSRCLEVRLSTRRRSLRTDDLASTSRALLTALSAVGRGEQLGIQWVLGRPLRAAAVPSRLEGFGPESWLGAVLLAPFQPPRSVDTELRGAMRSKQSQPGWQAIGRLSVQADSGSRQKQLLAQVVGALRSAEAPGVGFYYWRTRTANFARASAGWRLPVRLNSDELAAVSAFPVGLSSDLPVDMTGSRLLPPAGAIRRRGRIIGRATFPGRERPLALTPKDSLRHLHAIAPTGAGKSTLLLNLITQDLTAGRAVVVIEPKGDLIADVLARIPPVRLNDVVLLDPTDSTRPVGLNPLALHGRSPELVADQLLGMFHSLYAEHWGPRTQDIMGASLLTLARLKMSIAALPLLLTDVGFRRRVLPGVVDPLGLGPFWSAYESWSEAQKAEAIAPTMNKLRPLLMRPELRAMLGQKNGFDLRRVFTERRVLLVNLNKGLLGPETSALLGSLIVSQLWQAILGRSAIPPERRHPVFVYVDEFQDYLHLPVDFADALAQARGLGVGFTLAHQYLHQLEPAMRSAVINNAQSRVAFRLPAEDSRTLTASGRLAPEDFQSLGAFECYVEAVADGTVQPWCSAETLPAGKLLSDPTMVRELSRDHYGVDKASVEAELNELVFGRREATADDLTPRRRSLGGES